MVEAGGTVPLTVEVTDPEGLPGPGEGVELRVELDLRPQAITVRSLFSASTWVTPTAIAMMPVAPVTGAGEVVYNGRARPSCPEESSPHVRTRPSVPSAALCEEPEPTEGVTATPLVTQRRARTASPARIAFIL